LSVELEKRLQLARAYLAKLPSAGAGQGGDKRTYSAACKLVLGFNLSPVEALPLLLEDHERCQPPWSREDLEKRLGYADKKEGQRGYLLLTGRQGRARPGRVTQLAEEAGNASTPFPWPVPDYILWDPRQIQPQQPQPALDTKGRANQQRLFKFEWGLDLVRLAIVQQRTNQIKLSDELLATLIWGRRQNSGDWPRNWRTTLQASFEGQPQRRGRRGRGEKPFVFLIADKSLGDMIRFEQSRTQDGVITFNFHNRLCEEEVKALKAELKQDIKGRKAYLPTYCESHPDEAAEAKEELRQRQAQYKQLRAGARMVPTVRAIYMPVRVFGPSPLSGLTPTQCNVLNALTMELTRSAVNNGRPDKAQVVRNGSDRSHPRERPIPVCPFLGDGEWVLFNGTGMAKRSWAHGYSFSLKTWLQKAGYLSPNEHRSFFSDLKALAEPFGLVVAGWNKTAGEWRTLDDMVALCKSPAGRKWLTGCVVRVYTRSDWLVRWRQYFANRLGYTSIPTSAHDDASSSTGPPNVSRPIRTANDLQVWMARRGLTDGQLAASLKVHRTTVNHYRTGRRKWGRGFQVRLDAFVAGLQV
jgi:hypothetical protein